MLPESLLLFRSADGPIEPWYLDRRDHPWLRTLLDESGRYNGHPVRELRERLREPLGDHVPPGKQRLAAHIIARRLAPRRRRFETPPSRIRAALFRAAATGVVRDQAVVDVAAALEIASHTVEELLLADLGDERAVTTADSFASVSELALSANLALAQAFVCRASSVRIEIVGNARAIVRQAKLRGLLCVVNQTPGGDCVLEISGPLALFRRTTIYGRHLCELVPPLSWCRRYRLTARCTLRGEPHLFELRTGDPLAPGPEPVHYDSAVEKSFARDFGRATRDWDIIREPEPIPTGDSLMFPDFALVRRDDPARVWLLEILGFWTPDYVNGKLEKLRTADLNNLIVCIDANRNCADDELPATAKVVRYRRRVDVDQVLAIIDESDGMDALLGR